MYNDTNFFVNLDKISNNNYTYGKLKQKQKQKPKTRKPITAENHQGGNTNEIYYTLVVMIYDCIHSDKEETHRHMILLAQYLPMRSQLCYMHNFNKVYCDIPEETQIRNCYRNRVMTYAMQKINPNVIPTAGFGGENTWGWCFDGLPKHSTYAITTNGGLSDPEACRLFIGGVDALVQTLEPYALIVCGNYPQWLNTKYPGVHIIQILSYSQMWSARRCG